MSECTVCGDFGHHAECGLTYAELCERYEQLEKNFTLLLRTASEAQQRYLAHAGDWFDGELDTVLDALASLASDEKEQLEKNFKDYK